MIYDVNTFISYYEVFTEVLEAFPAQNVVPFYLEHDSKDLTPFLERMENATGERFRPTEEWRVRMKSETTSERESASASENGSTAESESDCESASETECLDETESARKNDSESECEREMDGAMAAPMSCK